MGRRSCNTHEHYIATSASGCYTVAIFQAVRAHLREHGHQAPYEMWIGPGSEVAVKALTGFVPVAQWGVNYAITVSTATGLNGEIRSLTGAYYIGMLEEFKVMVVPGIPLYYGFAYKSYGQNSSRNPLKVRLQKGLTRPQAIAMPNPNSAGRYPLQDIMLFTEFGVGVNDRTAGTCAVQQQRHVGGRRSRPDRGPRWRPMAARRALSRSTPTTSAGTRPARYRQHSRSGSGWRKVTPR